MTQQSFEEYQDLGGTGYDSKQPLPPEQEFFHSLYIAGKSRKNHINVMEKAGLLQIRGVEYNLEVVNMIISHVKPILVKESTVNNRTSTECFSYQSGEWPWKGISGRTCGKTSAERAAEPYCANCRSQILVAGIYTDEAGKPIKTAESKAPIFMFLRGKGTKYGNISSYLSEMSKLELDPIFQPVTEQSKKFESSVVNNKRYVTKISIGTVSSKYGDKEVFVLEKGPELQKEVVFEILKISKKTLEKFNEKFDWGRRKSAAASGYGGDEAKFEEPKKPEEPKKAPEASSFSFDDVSFE